jgi:hypothetical protein
MEREREGREMKTARKMKAEKAKGDGEWCDGIGGDIIHAPAAGSASTETTVSLGISRASASSVGTPSDSYRVPTLLL